MHFHSLPSPHALYEVDQKLIRIKFQFYKRIDKGIFPSCVILSSEILSFTFTGQFYGTTVRIGHYGVLILFFRLCLSSLFY